MLQLIDFIHNLPLRVIGTYHVIESPLNDDKHILIYNSTEHSTTVYDIEVIKVGSTTQKTYP